MPRGPQKTGAQERLARYRAKRSADRTPEPFGGEAVPTVPVEAVVAPEPSAPRQGPAWSRPRLFCIQKHAARAAALRPAAGVGGVLRSWAVPKGPSLDPAEKRLAVRGRGPPARVRRLRGRDPGGQLRRRRGDRLGPRRLGPARGPGRRAGEGQAALRARGYKLRGRWHAGPDEGQEQGDGKDWLLIKERGRLGAQRRAALAAGVGALGAHRRGAARRRRRARAAIARASSSELGAPRRDGRAPPASSRCSPRPRDGAVLDAGLALRAEVRRLPRCWPHARTARRACATAAASDSTATLSRRSRARSAALPFDDLVLDGEVVVLDDEGAPELPAPAEARAAAAAAATSQRAARRAAGHLLRLRPARLRGLRPARRCRSSSARSCSQRLAAARRAAALRRPRRRAAARRFYAEVGAAAASRAMVGEAGRLALPRRALGRLAEAARGPHAATSSSSATRAPRGSRAGLRRAPPRRVREAARSSTPAGSAAASRRSAARGAARRGSRRAPPRRPPAAGPLPPRRGTRLGRAASSSCEVRYTEWTERGAAAPAGLPAPARGQASRRSACARPERRPSAGAADAARAAAERRRRPRRARSRSRNLDKVFWPEEGYTKGDLIDYYRAISPWLLPYLRDRPLVLTRYPDGIAGKSLLPEGRARLRARLGPHRARCGASTREREIDYFVCDDVESLLYVAQPRHDPAARLGEPGRRRSARPDWCILDLDPKGAPFAARRRRSRGPSTRCATRSACRPSSKTSGSTGLHVLIPLGGQLHLRAVPAARRAARARRRRTAAGDRDHHSRAGRPRRTRLRRLPAERPRQAAGRAVHGAPGAGRARLGPAALGRGRRQPRPSRVQHPHPARSHAVLRPRSPRQGPHAGARPAAGPRAAGLAPRLISSAGRA